MSFILIHTDKSRIDRSVFKRGLFVAVLLFKIISNYIEIFSQVLLYLTTATGIKKNKKYMDQK